MISATSPLAAKFGRRALLAAPLVWSGCRRAAEPYFGNVQPPKTQRLVSALDFEPASIDPALSTGLVDSLVLSLFEGLTTLQPHTGLPMAGLATHYEASADGTHYTFYLRGHAPPRGNPLPTTGDLPSEFSRGRTSVPGHLPARWSDGRVITAEDFAFAWRRAIEPGLAAEYSYLLFPLRGAWEINTGKAAPQELGVTARDEFTLDVELSEPTPYLLELLSDRVACAVPRHIVQANGSRWTEPGLIASSGAFLLRDRRPYDSITLVRNPHYYDAGQVTLEGLEFLVTRDTGTLINQYRSGAASQIFPSVPALIPVLRQKRDFRTHPGFASDFITFNTRHAPFDDPRARYALNMATHKEPVAGLANAGNIPAAGIVPPTHGFRQTRSLPVELDGKVYDVLAHDPPGAREILARLKPRFPDRIELVVPDFPDSKLQAQVLREQWRRELGVETQLSLIETSIWVDVSHSGNFRHLCGSGTVASFVDPVWFLDMFARPDGYGSGWQDPKYNEMLATAKKELEPTQRMERLAACERFVLQSLPILPIGFWIQGEMRKPFVRGMGDNMLDRQQFKYVWIDTNWRP